MILLYFQGKEDKFHNAATNCGFQLSIAYIPKSLLKSLFFKDTENENFRIAALINLYAFILFHQIYERSQSIYK